MFWFFELDETDPIGRSYRRYFHRVKVLGVILLVLIVVVYVVGLPALQITYRFRGPRPSNGVVQARQKVDAWYFSVSGWHHVRSGQYGYEGCPWIVFIPIEDCFKK